MRQWLAAALAVAVAACAAPSRPTLGAAPDMAAPLDARVFPPYYGSVPIQLSKPAYVALFEVVPGRGAALLYPQAGTGFHQVTESWVPMRYSASRWLYATDLPGRFGYRSAAFNSGYDTYRGYDAYGFARPRYLFLVASEEPLAVEQFQGDVASIRRYLGVADYAAHDPYDVMERLAYAMLPFAPSDSWVMDVYVDWGYDWGHGYGPGMTAAQASYWPVVCGNGSVQYVRYVSGWGFATPPCLGASVVAPGTPLPPRPPLDSTVAPPAGEGHERTTTPDERGRRRAGAAATMEYTDDADAARLRQRITMLRDDATRPGFQGALTDRLRREVQLRQRAAAIRGHGQPAHLAADAVPGREVRSGRAASTRSRAGAAATRGESAAQEGARRAREARAETERARVRSERAAPTPSASSGSSSSGSSSGEGRSSGSSSGSSSGGRTRTTPPPI